jgi:hypothetical protein
MSEHHGQNTEHQYYTYDVAEAPGAAAVIPAASAGGASVFINLLVKQSIILPVDLSIHVPVMVPAHDPHCFSFFSSFFFAFFSFLLFFSANFYSAFSAFLRSVKTFSPTTYTVCCLTIIYLSS